MTLLHSHHQLSGFPVALRLSKEIKMWGLVRVEGGKEYRVRATEKRGGEMKD